MLKARGLTAFSRSYSIQSTVRYIAEENTFRFPFEQLSEEENKAAIPKKPVVGNKSRVMTEIITPENVADLYTTYDFNDIFVSCLAKRGKLGAGTSVVTRTPGFNPHEVELLYTKFVVKWIEVFNARSQGLQVVPTEKKLEYTPSLKLLQSKLQYEGSDLAEFYTSLKVFSPALEEELSQKKNDLNDITIFLASHEHFSGEENFSKLLTYVASIIERFTANGVQQVVSAMITNLSKSEQPISKVLAFVDFVVNAVYPMFPTVVEQLDAVDLDKFIRLSSLAGNSELSIKLMDVLIKKYNFAPSHTSFTAFLSSYDLGAGSLAERKIRVLQDFSPLKRIMYSYQLDSQLLMFMLNNTVETSTDLHHFIKFIEAQPNKSQLLSAHALHLLQALDNIHQQSSCSNVIKAVELTLLLRKLTVENTVVLDDVCKKQVAKMSGGKA